MVIEIHSWINCLKDDGKVYCNTYFCLFCKEPVDFFSSVIPKSSQ